MFKYKKIIINLITFLFIIFTVIEFIKYMITDSNLFGLIYLVICTLIIFLLVPCAYNYKKYYSLARISKLIIIILIGLFNSYLLQVIVLKSMNYIDSSKEFIKTIFIYKNVFKPLLYLILLVFTIFEFKGEKIIKTISNKNID